MPRTCQGADILVSSRRLGLALASLVVLAACVSDAGSGSDASAGRLAASAGEAGGGSPPTSDPCADPYDCACGIGLAGSAGPNTPASCVGTPLCNGDSECPPHPSGAITPVCQSYGDLVLNGFGGECILPCNSDGSCPGEMRCIGQRCRFVTFDPHVPCETDADCSDGFACLAEACDTPRRCRQQGGVCANQPVCDCNGVTHESHCDVAPEPIRHMGPCE